MTKNRRSFNREAPEHRRQVLIDATLDLIGETGFASATVRAIAKRANVTQGLIRHHFSTKEDLITAAYEYHMSKMTKAAMDLRDLEGDCAIARLSKIIVASLTPPVLSQRNLTVWASFMGHLNSDARIYITHLKTYLHFRSGLEHAIMEALQEAGKSPSPAQVRSLAIAANALIDGLWIEGCAATEEIDPDEIVELGLQSFGDLLDIELFKPSDIQL